MTRIWKIRPFDSDAVDRLVHDLSLSPLIARLLVQRGISDPSEARSFLNPSQDLLHSPFLFSEMEQAVERVSKARERGERVVIHGDYDVDGISGTAILLETLWELGIEVDYFLPHRIEDGYGLNSKSVQELAGQFDLMITVDCGATAVEEIALAREKGMDVIVTDRRGKPVGIGKAVMSAEYMLALRSGVAVKVRRGLREGGDE